MREILFRGKRKNNEYIKGGKWIEGNLLKANFEGAEYPFIFGNDFFLNNGGKMKSLSHALVIPETIGQYTGLTDKNGKKIFEGDILKFYGEDGDEESYTKYEVIWLENGWHAQDVHRLYMADTLSPLSWVKEHFEVIGNIYDNSELLEGDSQ